jgi:hypothetical protein
MRPSHVVRTQLQSAAGSADMRKPPAAPAPRPKLDPSPFGKSGVSISKNLGRAPTGALSEEVRRLHCDCSRAQMPAGDVCQK